MNTFTSSVKPGKEIASLQKNKKGRKELRIIIQFLESRMQLEKQRANKMIQFCNVWDQRIKDTQGSINEKMSDNVILPLIGLKPEKKNKTAASYVKDSPLMESLKAVQEESRNSAFSHYKQHLAISEVLTDLKSVYDEACRDKDKEVDIAADIIYKYMGHKTDNHS